MLPLRHRRSSHCTHCICPNRAMPGPDHRCWRHRTLPPHADGRQCRECERRARARRQLRGLASPAPALRGDLLLSTASRAPPWPGQALQPVAPRKRGGARSSRCYSINGEAEVEIGRQVYRKVRPDRSRLAPQGAAERRWSPPRAGRTWSTPKPCGSSDRWPRCRFAETVEPGSADYVSANNSVRLASAVPAARIAGSR